MSVDHHLIMKGSHGQTNQLPLGVLDHASQLINPRHMREGYGSRYVCVCVCVCVSLCVCVTVCLCVVTALAATYLIYTLKTRYH